MSNNFINDDTHECLLRFQGQIEDKESGFYYNRFRYYEPDSGNYACADPIGLQGGLTTHRYVGNPNGWIDPLGLASRCADVTKGAGNKVDDVIQETLSKKGNISSKHTLNSDQALDAGLKHLGPGYKEIGKPGSGVFRSADGTKQFRIDNNSLSGNHAPNVPHVHLETYKQGARKPTTNNHIPLVD